MDIDIRDEIDRSFGDGPPPPPYGHVLARGRQALRRRRLAGTAAVLAAVVVTGGALVAADGPGTSTAPPPPLATSSTTATPSPSPGRAPSGARADFPPPADPTPVPDSGLPEAWGVDLQPDGLHVAPGVTVLRFVDDPFRLRALGAWSGAAIYRDRTGTTKWYAGYVDTGLGGAGSGVPAANADPSNFDDWVDEQGAVLLDHGTPPPGPRASPAAEGRS